MLVGHYGRDARTSLKSGEEADLPRILFFENTLVLTGASGLLSGRANASSSPRLEDDGLALQARAGEGDRTIEEGWSHGKRLEGVV